MHDLAAPVAGADEHRAGARRALLQMTQLGARLERRGGVVSLRAHHRDLGHDAREPEAFIAGERDHRRDAAGHDVIRADVDWLAGRPLEAAGVRAVRVEQRAGQAGVAHRCDQRRERRFFAPSPAPPDFALPVSFGFAGVALEPPSEPDEAAGGGAFSCFAFSW